MIRRFPFILALSFASACGGIAYTPIPLDVAESTSELPALANAGADREILRGFETCLDGRATHHPQGLAFDVEWEQTAGEPVYLSNAQDLRPSFVAPLDEQELVFQLTASDGRFATHDEVRLYVKHTPRQKPPRVRAGPDRYLDAGQRAEPQPTDLLEGLAEDIVTHWERLTPEPVVDESSTRAANIHEPVLYRLQGVRDNLSSAPDHIILFPYDVDHTDDRAPVPGIEAETSVEPGATILLDASTTTDPNGDPVTFRWEQTGGSPIGPLGTTTRLTLKAPKHQEELSFRVFARDTLLESAPAKISIVVGAGGGADLPVVMSADQRARPDRVVMLDAVNGAATTQSATFVWEQTFGTPVEFETETLGRFLTFVAPEAPDDLAFAVFASNDTIDGPPAVARVTVVKEDENRPPTIYLTPSTSEPEPGQEVSVLAKITDPEHDAIDSCTWSTEVDPDSRVVSLDPGEVCTTPNAHNEVVVHFLAPPAGTTVTITLTAVDEFQAEGSARVDVTSTY